MFDPMGMICALAIGMALDVSSSITPPQRAMMFDGVASALEERADDLAQGVVLHIYIWGGQQTDVVMATMTSREDVFAATAALRENDGARYADVTAIGSAMAYGAARLGEAGCSDQRLNIITDGQNSSGPRPLQVRATLDSWALQINGVGIGGQEATVRAYLTDNVIYGSGAFVEYASDFDRAFREAIDRKLGRELMIGHACAAACEMPL